MNWATRLPSSWTKQMFCSVHVLSKIGLLSSCTKQKLNWQLNCQLQIAQYVNWAKSTDTVHELSKILLSSCTMQNLCLFRVTLILQIPQYVNWVRWTKLTNNSLLKLKVFTFIGVWVRKFCYQCFVDFGDLFVFPFLWVFHSLLYLKVAVCVCNFFLNLG